MAECDAGAMQVEEFYIDDVNGGFLDPVLVREAWLEVFAGYLGMQVSGRVPAAESGSHKVIKTRWVDTNKETNVLAPPLEAMKFLIAEALTQKVSRNNRPLKLSFVDVRKGQLCSEVLRILYIEGKRATGQGLEVATSHVRHE